MTGRWLAFALLALTLTACGAGRDDGFGAAPGGTDPLPATGDDPTPPDARLGTVALQLAATEPGSADWELVVRVFDPQGGDPVAEERLDLDALRRLVFLYLLPATYDITAEVIDTASGDVLMTGQAGGVVVLAQQTSSVTIALEPSAALQVLVDLDRGGRRFGCAAADTSAFTERGAQRLFGAQRLEDDGGGLRPRYYLWFYDRAVSGGWFMVRSWDVAAFDFADRQAATFEFANDWNVRCDSAIDVGGRFYAYCKHDTDPRSIRVSDDGLTWRHLADVTSETPLHVFQLPVSVAGTTWTQWAGDAAGRCALLADNQFNLFCGARDSYLGRGAMDDLVLKQRTGVVHAWAPDAMTWRGYFESLLSLDDPTIDETPNLELAFEVGTDTVDPGELATMPKVVGATLRGGVYQLWYVGAAPSGGTGGFGPRFVLVESVDRVNWTRPQTAALDPAYYTADCAYIDDYNDSFAVFTAPDGVHLYVLTTLFESGTTVPDYFGIDHMWSVD